ncbi:hypothetical protein JCM19233_6925 [Vibrio astriarenae]|nr:hypothetical protein JCM19233_6925 [Vibrio sp. C7]
MVHQVNTEVKTSLKAQNESVPTYFGAKPNLTESEQAAEAFWQRRRQMEELRLQLSR